MSGECNTCGQHVVDNFCDGDSSSGCSCSAVNNPQHYQGEYFEAIDIIEDFDLNFNLGNVIKYILRCDHKENPLQDLSKAKWYLEREISRRKSQG